MCNDNQGEAYSSPRVNIPYECERPPFDANRKGVEAFLIMGNGHRYMQKFCMFIGMHVMAQRLSQNM